MRRAPSALASIRLSNNPGFIGLAGIKFDYGLFVGNGLNLVTGRDAHDDALKRLFVQREPIGHDAAGGAFQILGGQLARGIGILDLNAFVHLEGEGRNIDFSAIDLHMTMRHQLAGGSPGIGETQMIDDIVQPGLQNLQHLLAGNTPAPQGAFLTCPTCSLPMIPVR